MKTKFLTAYLAYAWAMNTFRGPWWAWDRGEVLDTWSVTHIIWGAVAKRMGLHLGELLLLASLNEIGELWIRTHRPEWGWGTPEPLPNVLADIAITGIGWGMG